jgi:hypothetical protein
VTFVSVDKGGEYEEQRIREFNPQPKKENSISKGKAKKKVNKNAPIQERKGKKIVLIEFAQGVPHENMLSLYYGSDAPVGATGDQSFMEAYAMRSRKNKNSPRNTNEATPDIWYDVAEQQRNFKRNLEEVENKEINLTKQAQPGLKEIKINDEVDKVLKQKKLLFPIVMLINEALQKQQNF